MLTVCALQEPPNEDTAKELMRHAGRKDSRLLFLKRYFPKEQRLEVRGRSELCSSACSAAEMHALQYAPPSNTLCHVPSRLPAAHVTLETFQCHASVVLDSL